MANPVPSDTAPAPVTRPPQMSDGSEAVAPRSSAHVTRKPLPSLATAGSVCLANGTDTGISPPAGTADEESRRAEMSSSDALSVRCQATRKVLPFQPIEGARSGERPVDTWTPAGSRTDPDGSTR